MFNEISQFRIRMPNVIKSLVVSNVTTPQMILNDVLMSAVNKFSAFKKHSSLGKGKNLCKNRAGNSKEKSEAN